MPMAAMMAYYPLPSYRQLPSVSSLWARTLAFLGISSISCFCELKKLKIKGNQLVKLKISHLEKFG